MTRKVTPVNWDRFIAAYRSGKSMVEAAAEQGVSDRLVHRRMKIDPELARRIREARPGPTHGIPSTYRSGCRCGLCRTANTVHTREKTARRREQAVIPDFVQHGKATTYGNWHCRCDPCKGAHRIALQRQAARRKSMAIPAGVPHGTRSTYIAWYCRCRPCSEANLAYNRAAYALRRARQTTSREGTR